MTDAIRMTLEKRVEYLCQVTSRYTYTDHAVNTFRTEVEGLSDSDRGVCVYI